MKPRLKEIYETSTVPALMKRFGYKNRYQVPKFLKVVVHVGAGEAVQDPKYLEAVVEDLSLITGQRPVITRARRSVAAFRLRKGMPIGCKVTLRGDRMYEFLDRFINFAAPRIRDFRGFSLNSFDGRGGYSLGISEQAIFLEIDPAKVRKVFGADITIVTSARYDDETKALLTEFGMPFSREG